MKSIYLDYAAATPLGPEVRAAMEPYFAGKFYNPSATYLAARAVHKDLEAARQTVAVQLGARPAEIVFTAGATEANNLAIQGIMSQYPDGEALASLIEHESVLEPARSFNVKEVPVTPQGIIDLPKLEKLITPETVLVSTMLVNNELGTIQPIGEIAKILNKLRILRKNGLPLYLHTDAAQAGNYLDLHTNRLGVDLMSINGGKIYGPKQSGALYIKTGTKLRPLIVGGGQEFGLRSGTENVAGAIGLAKALELAQQKRTAESQLILEFRRLFEDGLQKQIPGALINGSKNHRAPHVLSVTFPGMDNERLMMELDEQGVQCAVGSACSASREEVSHVLSAIGLSDELARATLRFSVGRFTTKSDIQKVLKILVQLTSSNR
ncbi:MAG: cysteine desulfurase family protein [Candidatus Saccharimonadales bacterium]